MKGRVTGVPRVLIISKGVDILDKPNFVFLLVDDMGWTDIESYGTKFYETPNLNKLTTESMRFTDAYAACPVCSPTRGSLMTGKYPARVGVTDYIGGKNMGRLVDAPYIDHLPLSEITLASALKDGGYSTWHIGKWHLGGEEYFPNKHGFDINIAGCQMGHPWMGYFSPYHIPAMKDGPDGEYLTDRLGDEAVRLINERDESKPFYLNMWFYTVHNPMQAKAETIEKYTKKAADMGLDRISSFEAGEKFPMEVKKHLNVVRRKFHSNPVYAAMIEHLDDNVGKILDALEDNGIADNTVVIFTSDNGGLSSSEGSPTCNAPLSEGKGWMYEGGVREPLLIKWPGVTEQDSVSDYVVTSPDFYPTLLEMAGLPLMPNQHVDGVSMVDALKGMNCDRGAVYWHYPHYGNQGGTPGCSIRLGDYKLIEFFEDGRLELYNLVEDIGEDNNLVDAMPEKADELYKMLVSWRDEAGGIVPEQNPEWCTYD